MRLISLALTLLLLTIFQSVSLAEIKVQYLLSCCSPGTNRNIYTVNQWEMFDVVVWVRGTPGKPGVFAAYCDVEFDPSLVELNFGHPGAFSFKDPYTNGRQLFASPDNQGVVRSGAFAGIQPVGVALEVFRFRLRANDKGSVTFKASLEKCTSPREDTLLFGTNEKVDESEIFLGSSSITIK